MPRAYCYCTAEAEQDIAYPLLRLHSSDRHALKRELGWVISRLKECNFKLPCPSMTSGVQNQEAIEKQTKPVVSPYVICYVSARVPTGKPQVYCLLPFFLLLFSQSSKFRQYECMGLWASFISGQKVTCDLSDQCDHL